MPEIREMKKSDWDFVSRIYQAGMDTNLATFESRCPSYEEFDNTHFPVCRYVMTEGGLVIGWCSLSPVSYRHVYRGVAEDSIYMDESARGRGLGAPLLRHLIEKSEAAGFWSLLAHIMQDNTASVALHSRCDFREIGYREKLSRDRFGKWRNTIMLERRSSRI